MLVKGAGFVATMREFTRMTLISSSASKGKLCLDAPGMPTLKLPCQVEKTDTSVIHKVE